MFTLGSHSDRLLWLISPLLCRGCKFRSSAPNDLLLVYPVTQPSDEFDLTRQSMTSPILSFGLSTTSHLQKCSTYLKYFSLKMKLPTLVIKTTVMLHQLKGDWELFSSRPHEPRTTWKYVGRGKPCVLRGMHYRLNL